MLRSFCDFRCMNSFEHQYQGIVKGSSSPCLDSTFYVLLALPELTCCSFDYTSKLLKRRFDKLYILIPGKHFIVILKFYESMVLQRTALTQEATLTVIHYATEINRIAANLSVHSRWNGLSGGPSSDGFDA